LSGQKNFAFRLSYSFHRADLDCTSLQGAQQIVAKRSKNMRPETAQDQHDQMPALDKNKMATPEELAALLQERSGNSSPPMSSTAFDPIALAMENHPGLTREKAEAMAEAFGF
jgi:hypothetical protein